MLAAVTVAEIVAADTVAAVTVAEIVAAVTAADTVAAEITAAALGDKAAAEAAHGVKVVAVASHHRILTRLFGRGVTPGGG